MSRGASCEADDCLAVAGYTPVPVSVLSALDHCGVDLYTTDEDGRTPVLLCSRDYLLTAEDVAELGRHRVRRLLVHNADRAEYIAKLRAELDTLMIRSDVPPAERLEVLQLAVTHQLRTAFRLVQADAAVQLCETVGRRIARALTHGAAIPSELFGILRHNRGTFTHMVNVSVYAVLLAESLGESEDETLAAIATGALLHDIGKRQIPLAILDHPGRLTPEQRQIVATHPQRGLEEVRNQPELTWGQLMMIYQHHERMDGRGYPVRVGGDEIHPWARMCAVVDVFEAMTGVRPYRRPASVPRVLKMLDEEMAGDHLDAEMVRCWTKAIRET